MKKRFIVAIVTILMALTLFSGCGEKEKVTQSKAEVTETTTMGNYYLYETNDRQKYLYFLETLDESKYQVVDISIGYYGTSVTGEYINHYAVTYRTIEEIEN